jgi:hypothetical protein
MLSCSIESISDWHHNRKRGMEKRRDLFGEVLRKNYVGERLIIKSLGKISFQVPKVKFLPEVISKSKARTFSLEFIQTKITFPKLLKSVKTKKFPNILFSTTPGNLPT